MEKHIAKTILITGATDGIGLATATMLVSQGHHVLLHGRNADKLKTTQDMLSTLDNAGDTECYLADLSTLSAVERLAEDIKNKHTHIDVLINNAGIYKSVNAITKDKLDIRFAVNTIAPYLLTQKLLPILNSRSRVISLSSAAQSPVSLNALQGKVGVSDMEAYAQSKLALTMWSSDMAQSLKDKGPIMIAVNPGSLLASKMVKEGFGISGNDLSIGATILTSAALDDQFLTASGNYFDNDIGQFSSPHPDGLDLNKIKDVVTSIKSVIALHIQ